MPNVAVEKVSQYKEQVMIKVLLVAAVVAIPLMTKPEASVIIDTREAHCLAHNIYFEAANQPLSGRVAVGLVTLNRKKSPNYPSTICDVVYQAEMYKNWKGNILPKRHRCQFSWYCDGKPEVIHYPLDYDEIYIISEMLIEGKFDDITKGSIFYHADYVTPYWAAGKAVKLTVGDHIFY